MYNNGISTRDIAKQLNVGYGTIKNRFHFLGIPIKYKIRKGQFTRKTPMIKENNPNWRGGISFEPYSLDFDKKLKNQIQERDNYSCQICRYSKEQLGCNLIVHHIDYDKKNNNENNLICLCRCCHGKTNGNRFFWSSFLKHQSA